jgi:predicted transcriptional regulator
LAHKKTFVKLLDRACQLEELIISTHNLLTLDAKIWNILADKNISVYALIRGQYELFSVYYRSMFQASFWEDINKKHIDPIAYKFNSSQMTIHDKIIEHVDTTLAHQDVNDGNRRYVYENIPTKNINKYMAVSSGVNYHIKDAKKNVLAMKNSRRSPQK